MNSKYYTFDRKKPSIKYSCSPNETNKLKKICIKNLKGKYNTLEECAFSNECFKKQRNMQQMPKIHRIHENTQMPILNSITNRSYKMNNSQISKYEQKLYDRLGINNNNSSKNSSNLEIILSKLLDNDNLLILSEKHRNTPLKFIDKLLDILVELGFNYFLCETGIEKLPNTYSNNSYLNNSYSNYYLIIKKMCENKGINFINIETKETLYFIGSELRTSELVNQKWAQFALDILSQNDGSKIIYFIGTDHAGFGSSRFQTVPYLLKHPITIDLINSGKNKLSFNKPTHSCYNYLTLNH